MSRLIESLETRKLLHSAFSASINFGPISPRAPGLLADYGAVYGARRGGLTYGWSGDGTAATVDRNLVKLQKNDTFITMQQNGLNTNSTWDIAVENGNYDVYVVAGDPGAVNDRMAITVENELAVSGITRKARRYLEGAARVTVIDGKLTVGSASFAQNNKICYIGIVSTEEPSGNTLTVSTPANTAVEGKTARITITRDGDLSETATVPLTLGGTATNGVDYGRFGPRVVFAEGQAAIELKVRTVADGVAEGDETMSLSISPVAGYQVVEPTGVITISDPGTPPTTPSAVTKVTWATKASRPVAASEIFGAAVGNKVYTFGGYVDNTFKPSKAAYSYDVPSNTWTRLADLPVGLTHCGVAVDGTNIYYAGGYPGTGTNGNQRFATTDVYRYDTGSNTYTALPALPAARGAGALAKLGNFLYYVAGTQGVTDTGRQDVTTVYRLDLTNVNAGWTTRASLPAPRNHLAAIPLNGFIYAVGGQTSQDAALTAFPNVYRYNPTTDVWDTVASLPGKRSHITDSTFVYNGKIVVLAGQSAYEAPVATNYEYDPSTNKWSALSSIPAGRFSGVGDLAGGKFVYTAGYAGGFKNNTYVGSLA